MKIYCISDIHGCLAEFCDALSLILDDVRDNRARLVLLGDYIHGGADNYEVLDRIIELQARFGTDRVIALLGNHDEWVVNGQSTINNNSIYARIEEWENDSNDEDKYINWLSSLPRYYVEGNTIFVHAGINEDVGELWEYETDDEVFTTKYPAQTGRIDGLDMKVVAGHVGTAEISGDPWFHDIYFDGESHYYIDGSVIDSGVIPVLMVDTDTNEYFQVTEAGAWRVEPYGKK